MGDGRPHRRPAHGDAEEADNDLAVGRIIDIVSHSAVWKDSAIFIEEDDAQDGVDHVDGHRSPGYIVSPYAVQYGPTDNTYYTQVNMTRTIEHILGLQPLNQFDLIASPMTTDFTNTPDFTPWNYVPAQVPLTKGVTASNAAPDDQYGALQRRLNLPEPSRHNGLAAESGRFVWAESKAFFFEKKKQKAFASAVAALSGAARRRSQKFLVLFQKELLALAYFGKWRMRSNELLPCCITTVARGAWTPPDLTNRQCFTAVMPVNHTGPIVHTSGNRPAMNSNLACGLRSTAAAIVLLAAGAEHAAHAAAPASLTPPAGNAEFLVVRGQGTQNYVCEPSSTGGAARFVFIGPQSILSRTAGGKTLELAQNVQSTVPGHTATPLAGCLPNVAGNEQICPAFQSAVDQSVVWTTKLAALPAGTDPSCPNANSVACLLLRTVTVGPTPSYAGLLSRTSFVQRLETAGGNPPTAACTPGQLAFVPYTATYRFFAPATR